MEQLLKYFDMRLRLKFYFIGTLLVISHVAHAFILLTASMDDVKRIAKKFVSESLADKITDMLAKATEQMNTNLSKENEQNEDEFENISTELLTNSYSKDVGRQRFETKSKREEEEDILLTNDTTVSDTIKTFMEWDRKQMNEVSEEERQHHVDVDKPKPLFHDEDRLIDNEFENDDDLKFRENRGNDEINGNKQNNQIEQEESDHERVTNLNVRFDHDHEINEYQHESEKPTNDFDLKLNGESKEESKEAAQPDTGSKRDVRQKVKIRPKKDFEQERDIDLKKDPGPKRHIGPKRDHRKETLNHDIEPKRENQNEILNYGFAPNKNIQPQKPIEKQDENESQSSDEPIKDDTDAKFSEGEMKMNLRQATEPPTSEKSRYIQFMHRTKENQASSDKPKENNSMVKRPHHRLADSNEIKEDILNIQGKAVPFLKKIDDREYNEKVERRGIEFIKDLLATSGPIALPKLNNKLVENNTTTLENETWI